MAVLGILEERTIEGELLDAFQNDGYEIVFIGKNEQLDQVDGVVLPLTKKEELPSLVDWLMTCQKTPEVFIWVFSTISLDIEQDILMRLGANGVITNEEQLLQLSLVVKNTFSRLDHMKLLGKEQGEHLLLNPKNQSIWVNQTEQELTRKEYQLLDLLYEHQGTCVPYETLIAELWPHSNIQERYNLTNTIFHLRGKMRNSEELVIKTVRSKGYVLITKKLLAENQQNR